MTLKEVIEYLKEQDPQRIVEHGFSTPHAYPDDYDELSFEPAENVTVAEMLAHAEGAVDKMFPRCEDDEIEWGEDREYKMSLYTKVHFAPYGCYEYIGGDVTKHALDVMFGADELTKLRTELAAANNRIDELITELNVERDPKRIREECKRCAANKYLELAPKTIADLEAELAALKLKHGL